jgi:hypothetical protein
VVGRMAAAGRGSGAACRSLLAAVIFQFLLLVIFTVVTGVIVCLVIPMRRGGNKAGRGALRHGATPRVQAPYAAGSASMSPHDPERHNGTSKEAPPPCDAAADPGAADIKTAEHRVRAGAPGRPAACWPNPEGRGEAGAREADLHQPR